MTVPGEYQLGGRADLAVARVLAGAAVDDAVYQRLLSAIGESLGWDFGAWWEWSENSEVLHCIETWRSSALPDEEFEALSRRTVLGSGIGLPGRVLATGEPAWIGDLRQDPNFPRRVGAELAGLRCGFAFPVESARGPLGAIEMFASRVHEPDDQLLETMASLGSQLGQLIERRRAEREIRESNERRKAMLEAALDCVITIDAAGRIVEFNPAAEKTFGYRRADAIGGHMAELIIPPSLRARHREGFARLLETGNPRYVDMRLELTGMRADGGEFPVELTITRIDLPGPPMFTGYLRDITNRKRAEAELRGSRARIVEAADDARRRLERDLHDGAQARLANLRLLLRLTRGQLDGTSPAAPLLDEAIEELAQTTHELREFARGIHPAVLSDGGLSPALEALAARSRVPVTFGELPAARLPERVEVTVYFVVAEALTNVARYAEAERVDVKVIAADAQVEIEVRDDGRGGADAALGSGLRGLADRVGALDGSFEVISPPGAGTTVRATIPCAR